MLGGTILRPWCPLRRLSWPRLPRLPSSRREDRSPPLAPRRPAPLRRALSPEVVAFDAETGVPTGWRYDPPPHRKLLAEGDSLLSADHVCLPDAWTNAAIDADGTVYIGHMSGNLFALRDKDGDDLVCLGGVALGRHRSPMGATLVFDYGPTGILPEA